MNKKLLDKKARYVETSLFTIRHGEDKMVCQMRALYSPKDGIATLIRRKRDNHFVVHSHPFAAALPRQEVDTFFELFVRSALRYDPRVKFKEIKGEAKL